MTSQALTVDRLDALQRELDRARASLPPPPEQPYDLAREAEELALELRGTNFTESVAQRFAELLTQLVYAVKAIEAKRAPTERVPGEPSTAQPAEPEPWSFESKVLPGNPESPPDRTSVEFGGT